MIALLLWLREDRLQLAKNMGNWDHDHGQLTKSNEGGIWTNGKKSQ